nr:hypothetical protein [uncultured Rhodoferax sp.]
MVCEVIAAWRSRPAGSAGRGVRRAYRGELVPIVAQPLREPLCRVLAGVKVFPQGVAPPVAQALFCAIHDLRVREHPVGEQGEQGEQGGQVFDGGGGLLPHQALHLCGRLLLRVWW